MTANATKANAAKLKINSTTKHLKNKEPHNTKTNLKGNDVYDRPELKLYG
jgi:hypothetical protein